MDFADQGSEFYVILEGKVKILIPIDREIEIKIPKSRLDDNPD